MSFLDNAIDSYKKQTEKRLLNLRNNILSDLSSRFSWLSQGVQIGSLGDIVFTVSTDEVRTFRDYRRSTKARFALHERIGEKPILEYIAPDGEEITFSMTFHVELGVSPAKETERLRELCEKGEAMYLVFGSAPIGAHMWVIESVGESAERIDHGGRILVSQVEVTLKEYVPVIYDAAQEGGTAT